MKRVLFKLNEVWVFFLSFFRMTYIANICGHKTKLKGSTTDGNDTMIMTMPLAANGNPDYCLDCIGNMSIQCAWCGGPIVIGSPITLYIPKDPSKVPTYATPYKRGNHMAFVGCL